MKRRLWLGINVVFVVVLTILCLIMAVPGVYWGVRRWPIEARRQRNAIPFDKEIWQTAVQEGEFGRELTREYMVDDLLRRYDFEGWHRREVEELLGEPDWAPSDPPWTHYTLSHHINYLHFEFDENGQVKRYYVEWENYP